MEDYWMPGSEQKQLETAISQVKEQKGGFYIVVLPISDKNEWHGGIITPSLDREKTIVHEEDYEKMTDEEENFIILKTIRRLAKYALRK